MQCPTCGHEVQAGEAFCDECGAKIDAPAPAPPPAAPPAAPPPAPVAPSTLPPAAFAQAAPAQPPPPQPAPIPYDPSPAPMPAPPLPAPAPAPVAAATPAGATSGPRLVMKEGGAAYALLPGRDNLVGRTDPVDGIYPQIDLSPHDPGMYVSRRHALIHEQGGQWYVRDNNSTNYTVVGRVRVQPQQEVLVEPGDEIRFGPLIATFQA